MNKIFVVILLSVLGVFNIFNVVKADVISGNVKQEEIIKQNQIVDSQSGKPVDEARVTVPSKGFKTYSDKDGRFELDTQIDKKTIMSVEKEGYRPYSLTIDKTIASKPLRLGIEKSKPSDVQIETQLCHLGDDVYSDTSANSGDFKSKSVGVFYTNKFKLQALKPSENAVLVIGSVIGLDTKLARDLGQNSIVSVYSSPAEVFFNSQKIGELNINGDNQEIQIPRSLIRPNNEITIRTGRNLFQHAYVDYDDIEIANIRVELKDKSVFANSR